MKKRKSFSAFALNLRAMRGGLSQAEFAKFLGIPNQVTYHNYESGRVPKAHILQGIATILGTTIDELVYPISADLAFEIVSRAITNAPPPQSSNVKLTADSAKSFGEATGELINPKSIKAISDAFGTEDLSHDELSRLFGHIVKTANRAPVELMKYYVLIRYAVGKELAQRWKKKPLTNEANSLTNDAVQSILPKLIQRLKRATEARGSKSELAAWLGVHRQSVTDWLSGKQEPGGEITLKLLHWVEQQERQK